MNTKVKVKTADLLVAVRARRENMVREYEEKLAEHSVNQKRDKGVIVAALRLAAERAAREGELPEYHNSYRGGYLEVPCKLDRHRDEPYLDITDIDRLIKTLEMAADDTISIGADDAARYLG